MYKLFRIGFDGSRRYWAGYDTEQEALTARWNWARRGEYYSIQLPNGQVMAE
jgi:hypothetical protein